MEKKVSVIIPTYKGNHVIRNAVKSVLDQTYKNLEIIVVDDNGKGSEEQRLTYEALRDLIVDDNVRYIIHETNRNGSAARNTGVKNAEGSYISLLDDDDEYYPTKIEKQVKEIEALDKEYAMVYCSSDDIDENGKITQRIRRHSGNILKEVLLHEAIIGSDSILIKKECYDEIGGFDESFRRHQDFEFTARVASKWKIKAMSYVGVKYKSLNRNSPIDVDNALKFRMHFLHRLKDLINRFDEETREEIIVINLMQALGRLTIVKQPVSSYRKVNSRLQELGLKISKRKYGYYVVRFFSKTCTST